MEYTLIKYNLIEKGNVEWVAIRKGEIVLSGSEKDLISAKLIAEHAILETYSAEKILTKTLLGQGNNQLYLMRSSK